MDSFLSKCGANNSQDKSLVLRELRGPFEIAVWSLVMHFSRPRRKARLAEDRVRATELPRCKAIDQPCAEKSAAAFRQGSKMRRPSNWGCLQWLQPNQTFSSPLFFRQELFCSIASGLVGSPIFDLEVTSTTDSDGNTTMASKLHIHKPYVLKALSQPLDRPDRPGRHTIGEVLGQKQGSKRRKRSELSVAIDGDAIHLYDVRQPFCFLCWFAY